MISDKDRIAEKDDAKTVTSTQKETDKRSMSTGRPNIDDINKRNAEERKQEKRLTYIVVGIVLVLIIVATIYLFANNIFSFYIYSS